MMMKNQISTSLLRDDHDHDLHKKKKKLLIGSNRSEEILLPEDLILEIFTHLPPTSLLRFKSLSKSLHSLISNPDFLRRNTVHQFRRQDPSPSPPPGILLKLGQDFSDDYRIHMISPSHLHGDISDRGGYCYYSQLLQNLIDYGPEHDQPDGSNDQKIKFTVIDSCNGLLLYLNCARYHNPPGGKCIWYVCNPITKDYIKLPPLEEQEQRFKILSYSLASLVFDPSLSLTYKVVIWLICKEDYRLYVYSSETRSWRLSVKTNINDFIFRVIQEQHNDVDFRTVLLNGVLYWTTLCARITDVSLCYDVEKDSVWTLKFPKIVGYVRRQLLYFGVCGGGLRLIEKYYKPWYWANTFPSSFDVMEMNQLQLQQQHQDYQDGNIERDLWTVKYRVNIGDQEGYYANLIRFQKSMFDVFILDLYKTTTKAGGEGEEVLLCRRNHNERLVISFNLSDNTFGKELPNELWLTDGVYSFTSVLRYANITLFPLVH